MSVLYLSFHGQEGERAKKIARKLKRYGTVIINSQFPKKLAKRKDTLADCLYGRMDKIIRADAFLCFAPVMDFFAEYGGYPNYWRDEIQSFELGYAYGVNTKVWIVGNSQLPYAELSDKFESEDEAIEYFQTP